MDQRESANDRIFFFYKIYNTCTKSISKCRLYHFLLKFLTFITNGNILNHTTSVLVNFTEILKFQTGLTDSSVRRKENLV